MNNILRDAGLFSRFSTTDLKFLDAFVPNGARFFKGSPQGKRILHAE